MSIIAHPPSRTYEIVVVDSGSFDGCGEMLAEEFPEIIFVQSEQNIGFARANNLGFEHASGEAVWFLNPDTEVLAGAADTLLFCLHNLPDAGIFGDILCARMVKRGVAALITDGVVRDVEGVLGTNLPVWCDGFAAPPSVAGLTFVGWGEPIGCGGVAVFPNDIVVADQDGAVLIPQASLDHVLAEGPEQERMEAWIVNEVNNGAALPGLYPMNAETKARYAASKK